jgi:hypothetical protein
MSVGCSMEDSIYDEITDENNQQYPCFLNKFSGHKLIILIDPILESNLKIEKYFAKKGNPLVPNNENNTHIRIFKNSEVTIYALNESINYSSYTWFNKDKAPDTDKIHIIINKCLNKKKITKFILQDFTGNDTTPFYSNLLKTYDRNYILNHINMDVTQTNGGCRFVIKPDLIKLDEHGNFIQEKYLKLSKFKDSNLFTTILNSRINILTYPIAFYYSKLIESPEYELDNMNLYNISLISIIYNIDYDPDIKEPSYIISNLLALINVMLKDITDAKGLNDMFEETINIIHNRNLLYNTLKALKLE